MKKRIKKRIVSIFLMLAICLNSVQLTSANEITASEVTTVVETVEQTPAIESDEEDEITDLTEANEESEDLAEEETDAQEQSTESEQQPTGQGEADETEKELADPSDEEAIEELEDTETLPELPDDIQLTEPEVITSDTIVATEVTDQKQLVSFDQQPSSIADVQNRIDQWLSSGQKPQWEFEVEEELLPAGYYCGYVEIQENESGYWTLFVVARMMAMNTTIQVADFKTLKEVLENLDPSDTTVIELTNHITATDHIGAGTKKNPYITGNFVIDGQGQYRLNMGNYQFRLSGTAETPYEFSIMNTDLVQISNGSASPVLYGLFCIYDGNYAKDYIWNANFSNTSFQGTALVGTYNQDTYTSGVKRKFEQVNFTDVTIAVGGGWRGYNAVVFAENIKIAGVFEMHSAEVASTISGATHPTYQRYFKSPGTGHAATDWQSTTSTVANGAFIVESGAQVKITRDPGYGTDHWGNTGAGDYGDSTAYYRSLIVNYADFIFEDGSDFYAKAGTNRIVYSPGSGTENANMQRRTAIIRSNNASTFQVRGSASVTLETDYQNQYKTNTSTAAAKDLKGFTALSLRKSDDLTIDIEGTLRLIGGNLGSQKGTFADARSTAPAIIWGPGASTTTITGALDVESNTPNAWYYQYRTSKTTGKQTFIVEGGHATANLIGNNDGSKGANEYAAFEAYGTYDMDIQVLDGAVMNVQSNGYRGMSLASAATYNQKNITVDGAGSRLDISGVHWAIAAEGQPILGIHALNGGVINLATTGEVGDGYDKAGSAPSTVYSVGPTTYQAVGTGSEINVSHSGGTYSAIFHDGYGALTIDVNQGAAMNVESYNSGTNIDARRAAITVQNPGAGSHGDLYGNVIRVNGENSSFTVLAHNTDLHSGTYGVQQYSMGAISFGGYADLGGGQIEVTDGASFQAVSNSLAPTIFMNTGTVTFDNPGEYEIRNDATHDTMPTYKNQNTKPYSGDAKDYATVGQALYIGKASKTLKANLTSTGDVLIVRNSDITVWQVDKNHSNYDGGGYQDSQINTYWNEASVSAGIAGYATVTKPGQMVTPTTNVLGKWTTPVETVDASGIGQTTKFILPAYGRIMGAGAGYHGRQPEGTITKEANTNQVQAGDTYRYQIIAANSGTAVWANVEAVDELSASLLGYTGNYQVLSGDGVSVTQNGNQVVIHFGDIAAGTEKIVEIEVQVAAGTAIGTRITNRVITNDGVTGEDPIKPVVVGAKGRISKSADRTQVEAGQDYYYEIKALNEGNAVWSNVQVTDDLSGQPIYYTGQYQIEGGSDVTISQNGERITIDFGDLQPGQEKLVRIEVRVDDQTAVGTIIVNQVTSNDGKTAQDDVRPEVVGANGRIKKMSDVEEVSAGETYTYTITAQNLGNAVWRDVQAVDDTINLPISYTGSYHILIGDPILIEEVGQQVIIRFGDLLPGQEKIVKIEFKVDDNAQPGTLIKNSIITSDGLTAEDEINPLVIGSSREITKSADVDAVAPGGTYMYTITAHNLGGGVWHDVIITDDLRDQPITYTGNYILVSADQVVIQEINGQVIMDFGDLLPGQEKIIQIEVRVKDDAKMGTVITNKIITDDHLEAEDDRRPEIN